MASLGTIKQRQEGIAKIRKVAQASEVVAATRLRRIEKTALNTRPYAEGIRQIVKELAGKTREKHTFIRSPSAGGVVGIAVITSDRGLCGGFNANVFRAVNALSRERKVKLLVIGRKGRSYFQRRGFDLVGEYTDLGETRFSDVSSEIGQRIISLYKSGEVSEIKLIYNKFRLHLLGRVSEIPILPVNKEKESRAGADYIYEPAAGEILNKLIPEYIAVEITQALFESKASEEMARMVAMKYARDNADELIEKLMLDYHKARQAMITREIIEVVSGQLV